MTAAYELMQSYQPTAILYPLRGSEVFKLSFERIAEVRNERESLPASLILPIGTYANPYFRERVLRGDCKNYKSRLEASLSTFSSRYEKRAIVHTLLERYAEQHSLEKILLIDEVVNGGSIIQNLKHVYPCLEPLNADIEIFAMEFSASSKGKILRDSLGNLVSSARGRNYRGKRDNGFKDIRKPFNRISLVPPLVLDKQHFLPLVVREHPSGYEMTFYTSAPRITDILHHVAERAKEESKDLTKNPYLRISDSIINS